MMYNLKNKTSFTYFAHLALTRYNRQNLFNINWRLYKVKSATNRHTTQQIPTLKMCIDVRRSILNKLRKI